MDSWDEEQKKLAGVDDDSFGFESSQPVAATVETQPPPETTTPTDSYESPWASVGGEQPPGDYEAPPAPTGWDGETVPPPPPPPTLPPGEGEFGFGTTTTTGAVTPDEILQGEPTVGGDGKVVEPEQDPTGAGAGGAGTGAGAEPETTGTGDGGAWDRNGDGVNTPRAAAQWGEANPDDERDLFKRSVTYKGIIGYFPYTETRPVTDDTEVPADKWWMKLEDPHSGGWYSLNPDGTYNYHSSGATITNATGAPQGLHQRFTTTLLKARRQFGDGVIGHAPMMEAMGLDPNLSPREFNMMLVGPEGEGIYRQLRELAANYSGVKVEGEDSEMGFPTSPTGSPGSYAGDDPDIRITDEDPDNPGGGSSSGGTGTGTGGPGIVPTPIGDGGEPDPGDGLPPGFRFPGEEDDPGTGGPGDGGGTGGPGDGGGTGGPGDGSGPGDGTGSGYPDGRDPISGETDEWAARMRGYAADSMDNPSRWNADLVQQGMDVINQSLDRMRQRGGTSLSERFASRGLQGSSLEGQAFTDFEGELARQGQEQSWNLAREMANTHGEDRDRAWNQGRGVMGDQFSMDQMIADERFRYDMMELQERGMDESNAFRQAEQQFRQRAWDAEFGEGRRRFDEGMGMDRDRFLESQRKNTMDFIAWWWGINPEDPEFPEYVNKLLGIGGEA